MKNFSILLFFAVVISGCSITRETTTNSIDTTNVHRDAKTDDIITTFDGDVWSAETDDYILRTYIPTQYVTDTLSVVKDTTTGVETIITKQRKRAPQKGDQALSKLTRKPEDIKVPYVNQSKIITQEKSWLANVWDWIKSFIGFIVMIVVTIIVIVGLLKKYVLP